MKSLITTLLCALLTAATAAQTYRAPVEPTALKGFGQSHSTTSDGLTLYSSEPQPPQGRPDIAVRTRASLDQPWGPPTLVNEVNTSMTAQAYVHVRGDNLELFVTRFAPPPTPPTIYRYTRAKTTDPWSNETPLTQFGPAAECSITGDGLEFFYADVQRANLHRATRADLNSPWSSSTVVAELTSSATQGAPCISGDGLTMVFGSDRGNTPGDVDLWITRRADRNSAFGAPTTLTELNTTEFQFPCSLSADGFSCYHVEQIFQQQINRVYRADLVRCACYPENGVQPAIGQTFRIYVRRDDADVGKSAVIVGSLARLPAPVSLAGLIGDLELNLTTAISMDIDVLDAEGKFTAQIPVPNAAALTGVKAYFQGGAQDVNNQWYLSRSVRVVVE